MKTSRSNFLCGFMGAGKSTLIKEINSKENITCMDLDLHIENLYGPINKIFEDKGEIGIGEGDSHNHGALVFSFN